MNVIQGFKLSPGCCHVCRRSDQSLWVIDARRDDPATILRQNVYLCQDCVRSAMEQLTPFTGLHVVDAETVVRVRAIEQEHGELVERLRRAEELLATLGSMANEAVGAPS